MPNQYTTSRHRLTRFWSHVEYTSGCWLWSASKDRAGYGQFHYAPGRTTKAHRWLYEEVSGSVPVGLELDHLCRNRACVRPTHLEPVTHAENVRRGHRPSGDWTHCQRGHPFDARESYTGKWRFCRVCHSNAQKRRARCRHREAFSKAS